ncbi:MAG: hypothetical protein WDW36_006688 [Sanguina aurantia]
MDSIWSSGIGCLQGTGWGEGAPPSTVHQQFSSTSSYHPQVSGTGSAQGAAFLQPANSNIGNRNTMNSNHSNSQDVNVNIAEPETW